MNETPPVTKYRHKPNLLRTPVPHLLQSNKPVTEEDSDRIQSALSRVRAEVVLLKGLEIAEPSNGKLYPQRLACEEFIAKHENLFHWTRRLPSELLVNIFRCLTEGGSRIPWRISHVCRKWRSIALSTPELWRRLPLRYLFLSDRPSERRFLRFLKDDYLKRSKGEPITFAFYFGHSLSAQLYAILLDHTERWGDIHLGFRQQWGSFQPGPWETRLAELEGRLYSLRSVKLYVSDRVTRLPLTAFRSAPRLRYLIIDGVDLSHTETQLQDSWPSEQVTHYVGNYCFMFPSNNSTLTQFTNLEYIYLGRCLEFDSSVQHSTLTFPKCKSLILRIKAVNAESANFLNSLDCPLLAHFHVSYEIMNMTTESFTDLAKLVQRHSEQLTSLHWQYDTPVPFHPVVLFSYDQKPSLEMMERLNHLQTLRITEPLCDAAGQFLGLLSTNPSYLPSLQQLYITLDARAGADEVEDFCNILRDFVNNFDPQNGSESAGKLRGFGIQLEVPQPTDSSFCMTRWDVISCLEGWTQDLQEGWEAFTRLETELEKVKGWAEVLQAAVDRPTQISMMPLESTLVALEGHNITDPLVLYDSRVYFILRQMTQMVFNMDAPASWRTLRIMERAERLYQKWTPLLVEHGPSRRWTAVDTHGIIYVPPSSPLRADPWVWLLGAENSVVESEGHMTEQLVSEIDYNWADDEGILRGWR